jgi:EmrB/QacA subfamily drug resistance transporter
MGKRIVFIVAIAGSFIPPFMGSALNIALPSIGREFSMSAVSLGWLVTAYVMAASVFLVPFGRLSDIKGRKRIYLYGAAVFTVSSLLLGLGASAGFLIAFRAVQGFGGAMMLGTGMAMLISVFPPEERGKVLGFNVAAVYLGLSLGPTLGGILTQHFGWRSIFFVNVPVGLFIIVLILWKLKEEWAESGQEKFDAYGAAVYSAALLAMMYGFTHVTSLSGGLLFAAGVCGLAVFVMRERKTVSGIINLDLFRNNTVFVFSNLATLINYSATSATSFLLSLYLQYIKGVPPQKAGLVLVIQPVIQAVFSPAAGRLSDSIEPRIVSSLGMGFTCAGLFQLAFLGAGSPFSYIIFVLCFMGVGFALFSSPNTNAIMGSVERKYYGIASGIVGTMRLTGNMMSMGVTMLVFSFYIGKGQMITPDKYPLYLRSMRLIFALLCALCFAGIFASVARGKVHGTENPR